MFSFFEKPNNTSENNNEMRKRVDALGEDRIRDMAKREDRFREQLKKSKMSKENIDDMADEISNEILEKNEAQKESFIDPLTKLRNRRSLEKNGIQVLSIENRNKKDVSVLLLDFDYFKKVNDEFGHGAGDEALKFLAKIIEDNIRHESDSAYRYGGEEFIVLLPGADSKKALSVAEKIRKAVEAVEILVHNKEGEEIKLKRTLSIGVSGTDQVESWGEKKYTAEEIEKVFQDLQRMADAALYVSKENGRNRVVVFSEKEKEAA